MRCEWKVDGEIKKDSRLAYYDCIGLGLDSKVGNIHMWLSVGVEVGSLLEL